MRLAILLVACFLASCKQDKSEAGDNSVSAKQQIIKHAKGFSISQTENGISIIKVNSPWPDSDIQFHYALVPKDLDQKDLELPEEIDAVIPIPVRRLVVTSTTHIPALESLGVADRLIGFPQTDFISSPTVRKMVENGQIANLGANESINTEITIALDPEVIVGFGIDNRNTAYQAMERSGIPVIYNGDWTEESPLGKAEWIKFFGPLFQLEQKADSIFNSIESEYLKTQKLALSAQHSPTVLSGALYKDVWYAPGGDSWAAQFIRDANADYIWKDSPGKGSLSLSLETVLLDAGDADFWISPSQFSTYDEMEKASEHYSGIRAFEQQRVFTFARTRGATGGLLYYELAPSRPDVVLKDLIHIFHPELLPDYETYFFKELQ